MKAESLADELGALLDEPPGPDHPLDVRRTVAALRETLHARLQSTGGRPTDPTWTLNRLVPMREQTWSQLKHLAEEASTASRKASPAQVAALLLEQSLAATGPGADEGLSSSRSSNVIVVDFAADLTWEKVAGKTTEVGKFSWLTLDRPVDDEATSMEPLRVSARLLGQPSDVLGVEIAVDMESDFAGAVAIRDRDGGIHVLEIAKHEGSVVLPMSVVDRNATPWRLVASLEVEPSQSAR